MTDPVDASLQDGDQLPGLGSLELARRLCHDPTAIRLVAGSLSGPDPRVRSGAAEALAELGDQAPNLLVDHVPALVMALENEETPTRVGVFRALAAVASGRPDALEDDIDEIRLGLFDPINPAVRRFAALAVARFGQADVDRARRVFPHLAEALRRFHDDEQPGDLLEGFAVLARGAVNDALLADIWRAVRRHEKHPDPSVRARVEEIAACARRGAP